MKVTLVVLNTLQYIIFYSFIIFLERLLVLATAEKL